MEGGLFFCGKVKWQDGRLTENEHRHINLCLQLEDEIVVSTCLLCHFSLNKNNINNIDIILFLNFQPSRCV